MRQDGFVSSDPTPTTVAEPLEVTDSVPVDNRDLDLPPQVTSDAIDNGGDRSDPVVVLLDPTALEVARQAAEAEAGHRGHIGRFTVAVAEDEFAVTAQFAAAQPG